MACDRDQQRRRPRHSQRRVLFSEQPSRTAFGTFETWRRLPRMSVYRGTSEVIVAGNSRRYRTSPPARRPLHLPLLARSLAGSLVIGMFGRHSAQTFCRIDKRHRERRRLGPTSFLACLSWSAIRKPQQRFGAGLFRRRDYDRSDNRSCTNARCIRHWARDGLFLQE
jgi:hypothetical protein